MGNNRPWWIWLLVLIAVGLAKAHIHFIRLLVVAAAALGGMYMLHILAQDYNKITKGWPFTVLNNWRPGGGSGGRWGIFKRSTDETEKSEKIHWLQERIHNDTVQFKKVIRNDPVGCARKYVCHISAKNAKKLSGIQQNVLTLIRSFRWLDTGGEWQKAEEIGKKQGKEGACEKAYKKCYYSGTQLEKLMNFF